MDELIPIVDDNDNMVSYKDRSKVTPEDIYRVAGLMVYAVDGSKLWYLLAQRAASKKINPNKWSISVVGTVGMAAKDVLSLAESTDRYRRIQRGYYPRSTGRARYLFHSVA